MTYLVSKNIKLVKFTSRYITPRYISWLNDHEINRFMSTGRMPVSADDVSNRNDSCNIMFGIKTNIGFDSGGHIANRQGHDEYIGTVAINGIDWINRNGEIGYMIGDKEYWGYGLATQVVELVSDYALNRLNLHKIEAGVVAGNIGSIKVLEKNGFEQYALIPEEYWLDNEFKAMHRFYKLQGWK